MLLVTTGTDGRCDGLWNLIGVFLEEGILCRRVPGKSDRAVVIPPALQRRVCLDCHDRCGHPGVAKVQHRVESRYYWDPSAMRATVRNT